MKIAQQFIAGFRRGRGESVKRTTAVSAVDIAPPTRPQPSLSRTFAFPTLSPAMNCWATFMASASRAPVPAHADSIGTALTNVSQTTLGLRRLLWLPGLTAVLGVIGSQRSRADLEVQSVGDLKRHDRVGRNDVLPSRPAVRGKLERAFFDSSFGRRDHLL